MLPSATFSREVLDELRCLDEAIAAICEGAESLRAGHLVNVANLTERLHAAAHRVVTVRERLAQVAEEAGCDGWEWEDREGLDQAVVEAVTRLAAREAERPRAALLGLVGRLASGSVVHRRESKRQEFEASRHRALEEIRRALAADLPPEFPIPRDPGTWLADAWELRDPELACFLNALGPKYPELAGFVENVEPGMWRDGESGTDSTSALAPARPPETLPVPPPAAARVTAVAPVEPLSAAAEVATEPGPVEPPPSDAVRAGEPPQSPASPPLEPPPAKVPVLAETSPELRTEPPPEQPPVNRADEAPTVSAVEPLAEATTVSPAEAAPARALTLAPRSDPGPRAAAPVSAPAAEPLPPRLPDDLSSFKRFCEHYWIAPDGRCVPVPWDSEDFADRVEKASHHELARANREEIPPRLSRLHVFARAAAALGRAPLVEPRDLEAFADAWAAPRSTSKGQDAGRAARLRAAHEAHQFDSRPLWRLGLFLEAVRPNREEPLSGHEATSLSAAAGFHHQMLKHVIDWLFRRAAAGAENPVERLRAGMRAVPADSAAEVETRLGQQRKEFHTELVRLWKAAGGKIERSHCRRAWDEFIETISPNLKALYPVKNGGRPTWDPAEMQRMIDRLPEQHARIADRYGAKYADRHKMDRAALALTDQADGINKLVRRLQELRRGGGVPVETEAPVEEVKRLDSSAPFTHPDEELCRLLLLRLLAAKDPSGGPGLLDLTEAELCAHPDLLAASDLAGPGDSAAAGGRLLASPDLGDARRVASVLLGNARTVPPGDEPASLMHLKERLARSRPELLARLPRDLLTSAELGRIRRARETALEHAEALLSDLERACVALDELGLPGHDALGRVCEEGRRLTGDRADALTEPGMLREWLARVRDFADRTRDGAVQALLRRLPLGDLSGKVEEARAAIGRGHYAHALWLLGERTEGAAPAQYRETLWRDQAQADFPDPPLRAFEALPQDELVEAWRKGIHHSQSSQKLLRLFAEYVFAESRKGKGQSGGLYEERDQKAKAEGEFRIPCAKIRQHLARQKLNPCYLPQLAGFEHVVIVTAPVQPSERAFVAETAKLVTDRPGKDFVVVLTPKLHRDVREALLAEFHRRPVAAAAVDDLDLCRLLNPQGRRPNPILGFFELTFEQQPWLVFSPFAAPDGQHVQMEMYVGRREEAQQLTGQAKFSSLFSGRKLGKSALLKFIEKTEDGNRLPSGNELRVLYVPAAGAESEADVVHRILDEVRRRLGFDTPSPQASAMPGDALVAFFNRFTDEQTDKSLLVVLDESDVFVEAQFEEYEKNRERCLSFRMRTDVQARTDMQGLPRVRFVFSGYRATHRREGAWVNWGEVLRLTPLKAGEASQLIAGPLARLGIDATGQAPAIAYRCGYQPAIILIFGGQLLKHLQETRPRNLRGRVEVRPEDVATVINDHSVKEAIHEVVKQNFQGNRPALITFSALLLEFVTLPPGGSVEDAPRKVLERLAEFGPLDWLEGNDVSHLGAIVGHLRDFAERQLLVEERQELGESAYRLKFPHHLPVLCQADPENVIRKEIEARRQEVQARGQESAGRAANVRALLTATALRDLRDVIRHPAPPDYPVRAAVVASLWPEGVGDESAGIPDRLGVERSCVVSAAAVAEGDRVQCPVLAVLGAAPCVVEEVLRQRKSSLAPPLFLGGADLLRWVLRRPADEFFEVHCLGRLPANVLWWWFERVRALEFPVADALEQAGRRTGGIPCLVRQLDRLLLRQNGGQGGFNVSEKGFADALAEFDGSLSEVACGLRSGGAAERLEARELQLLQMVAAVSRMNRFDPGTNLYKDLTEDWELYQEECPAPPLDKADDVPLRILQGLGLLPATPDRPVSLPFERLAPVSADDPLLKILPHLEAPR